MRKPATRPPPRTRRPVPALRIDRIFRSTSLPAEVTGYRVRQPPRDVSDHAYVHAYVHGTYRLNVPGSTEGHASQSTVDEHGQRSELK